MYQNWLIKPWIKSVLHVLGLFYTFICFIRFIKSVLYIYDQTSYCNRFVNIIIKKKTSSRFHPGNNCRNLDIHVLNQMRITRTFLVRPT